MAAVSGGSDEWLPEELREEESVGCGRASKPVKRPSNLIGSHAVLPPEKVSKRAAVTTTAGRGGNFVKLNMKRNGRKFLNKRGKSNISNRRRPFKKFKKKLGTGDRNEDHNEKVFEEDGSVIGKTEVKGSNLDRE